MKVSKRSVFLIGGYDPQSADEFFARVRREVKRFEATWGLTARLSPVSMSADGAIATADIEARGEGWTVVTQFGFLILDGVVRQDLSRPRLARLSRYLVALADYVASGTFFKMARKAWRFALFFAYPPAIAASCAVLGLGVGLAIGNLSPLLPARLGIVGGLVAFGLMLCAIGKRQRIFQLMELWTFSRDFLRGRRPDVEALLEKFATTIAAHARESSTDELILVGHSTGGGLILDLAARCIAVDPDFAARSTRTAVLTLGSTALAFGMHPAATAFRGRVQTLVDDPHLAWVDVQCLVDPINFYKSDPVADMGLTPRVKATPPGMPFALARTVRLKEMVDAAAYTRIKRKMLRIHYQYIFGNTKRYFYDFFMVCCGPLPLAERMRDGLVGDRAPGEGAEGS